MFAYIKNLSTKSHEQLLLFFEKVKDVPVVLIGTRSSCEHYIEQTKAANIKKTFAMPMALTDLIAQLRDVLSSEVKDGKTVNLKAIRKHILVVDDDPIFLRTMMNWLKGKYLVSVARNGFDAIDFLQEEIPNLILLDYEMPDLNGIQTLEEIRAKPSLANIPVAFLTGVSDGSVVKNAIRLKPSGYILKTVKQPDLLAKIADILQEERTSDPLAFFNDAL